MKVACSVWGGGKAVKPYLSPLVVDTEYSVSDRYDDFAVIMPESGLVEAEGLRVRIEQAVRSVSNQDLPGRKGAALGAAAYPEDGEPGEELFAAADHQVYANKAVS